MNRPYTALARVIVADCISLFPLDGTVIDLSGNENVVELSHSVMDSGSMFGSEMCVLEKNVLGYSTVSHLRII